MHAGPAIVISMVLAGVVSALAGLCYAEFASTVPIAGSAYTYSYATLGEFVAWIIGWDLVLEYALGAATVAVGWSGYFVRVLADLGIHFPAIVSAAPGTVLVAADGSTVTAVFNLPAVVIAILVTTLLVRGVQESARVNGVMVVVKVAVVLLVIAAGISFVDTGRFTPLVPPNTGTFGEFGWSGVMRGAAVIFFAYIGFDAVSTAAQEARNPQRDMPIGILGSLAICTVLYVAVAVGHDRPGAVRGARRPGADGGDDRLRTRRPRGDPRSKACSVLMPLLVKIGILAGLTSTMVVQMMAQPRIFMAMSNDGLLPPWMGRVHPRFGTPHLTTIATGAVVSLAAGLTPIDVLGHMVSIGTLFAFVVVSAGVLVLRRTHPDLTRPFTVPWSPLVPALSALRVAGADAEPAGRDVDTAVRVDGGRRGDLLRLRVSAEQAEPADLTPDGPARSQSACRKASRSAFSCSVNLIAEPRVVELDHVGERRRRAVVEVWGARGQRAQDRSLELADVAPLAGDHRPSGIGRLHDLAGTPVTQGVERQFGCAPRGGGDADVERHRNGVIALQQVCRDRWCTCPSTTGRCTGSFGPPFRPATPVMANCLVLKIASPRAMACRSGEAASLHALKSVKTFGSKLVDRARHAPGMAGSMPSGSLMPMQNGSTRERAPAHRARRRRRDLPLSCPRSCAVKMPSSNATIARSSEAEGARSLRVFDHRIASLDQEVVLDRLTGRSLPAVPHHRTEEPEVGGWQRTAVHRDARERTPAAVWIVDIDHVELRALRNLEADADHSSGQQQAERVASPASRRHVRTGTIRSVVDAEDRIESVGRVEPFAKFGRSDAPRLRRPMAGEAAPPVDAEFLEERVAAIEHSPAQSCGEHPPDC